MLVPQARRKLSTGEIACCGPLWINLVLVRWTFLIEKTFFCVEASVPLKDLLDYIQMLKVNPKIPAINLVDWLCSSDLKDFEFITYILYFPDLSINVDICWQVIFIVSHDKISHSEVWFSFSFLGRLNAHRSWTMHYFILYFILICFNLHLRICLLILEKEERGERKREREREREREPSIDYLLYVPRPGIKPANFWCMEQHSNQLSHLARASLFYFT